MQSSNPNPVLKVTPNRDNIKGITRGRSWPILKQLRRIYIARLWKNTIPSILVEFRTGNRPSTKDQW
jgi:hypothetical protein